MKYLNHLAVLFLLSAVSFAQHSVALSWGASTTAGVTYTLNRGTVSGQENTYAIGITGTSYNDTLVQPGATYFYNVIAVCGTGCPAGTAGNSAPTNEVKAVIPANTPGPPSNLVISQIAMNPPVIQDTWALSTLPNVYEQLVFRQGPSSVGWNQQKVLKPTVSTYTDLTAKKGKTYSYEIAVADRQGKVLAISQPSLQITVK